jgi:hypothetical protein
MLAPGEFERFAEVCTLIGNEVADDGGFVPIRKLLAHFHARLFVRPLLVEGMLASIEHRDPGSSASQWIVLVDSETYQVSHLDIMNESHGRPLPSRLRNTVAHELVHSLAFRPSEFGIRLQGERNSDKLLHRLVEGIERETERLSPLLLWSDKALANLLSASTRTLSVQELDQTRKTIGISRHVLINRFRLLRSKDPSGFLNRPGLRDIAVGMGEWTGNGTAVLRKWPLFVNFERSIMPTFFVKVSDQDRLPAKSIFPDDRFAMCGGSDNSIEFVTAAGTQHSQEIGKMTVECSIGQSNKRSGSEFLYAVRKLTNGEQTTVSASQS